MAARTKAKARKAKRSGFRSSWKGQLRFGLVSFQVEAVNAHISEKSEIHFHLLHAPDHERIHYAKVCPKHGEVPNDEIVEGFEHRKGKYIEIEKEELDQLRTEKERALSLDAFVPSDEIDPIYFDGRMYYLLPSGEGAAEPYLLLTAAMEKKKRWGVGQVVFSGKEQLVVIRPVDGILSMAMLNYDAEIRKASEISREFIHPKLSSNKLRLAEDLVAKWQESKFSLAAYKDTYREKVKKALEAKRKGVELPEPETDDAPDVINIMEALKKSLDNVRGKRRSSPSKKRKHG